MTAVTKVSLPPVFLGAPLAHRALHDVTDGRPENSRAAIRAAMARGYGLEIDLQLSRDGLAMVFHDDDLDRLTGESGPVAARDAQTLARIRLRGVDEGVPSFAEVLDLVAARAPLLVELKDQHGALGPTDGRLEQAVAQDLQGYEGPLALMSFNPSMMVEMARLAPDWPRGIVTCAYTARDWPTLSEPTRAHLQTIPDYVRAGAVFVSHDVHDLHSPHLRKVQDQGAVVFTWTVRSTAQEKEARKVAQNITFEGYLADIPA